MGPNQAFEAVVATVDAIRATVPDEEQAIFNELFAAKYGHAVETAGPVAVAATEAMGNVEEAPTPKDPIDGLRTAYLDPIVKMSLADQLQVMTSFWAELGKEVPKLSEDQQKQLEAVLEASPTKRVIPTLLTPSPADRPVIAEGAKRFPKNQLNPKASALWTPNPRDWVYGQLLEEADAVIGKGNDMQAMGYKTPAGVITSRSGYIESLRAAGQTVEGEKGAVWTFPVTDVSVASPRTYDTAGNLHKATNTIETPEMLIYTQLLHQANGTPNPNWAVDFANEGVYQVREAGRGSNKHLKFLSALNVASVGWDPDDRQVDSDIWDPQGRSGYFGRRDAASGISKV